jgi:hypothetical protein
MLIYQFASKSLMTYSTNPSILAYNTPFLIERKMESAAEELASDCRNLLFRKVFPYSPTNGKTIADYTDAN